MRNDPLGVLVHPYHECQLPDRETAQDLVNRLGSDGWELVGFDVHNQAWFKRPLADVGATETITERKVAA